MPGPSPKNSPLPTLCAALAFCAYGQVQAQTAEASRAPRWGLYLQAARTPHHVGSWTVGATLDWQDWHRSLLGAEVRGYWDFSVSRWSARGVQDDFGTTVLGITPSFRIVPQDGHSRWFLDTGVGATLGNRRFVTPEKALSTRFNFATHVGIGVALGEQRQHELQFRLEHVSNAGIKKPNPGANFAQLRYTLHF